MMHDKHISSTTHKTMKFKHTTLAILMVASGSTCRAITLQEAADAILGRNGDRMQTELLRDAKNAETLSIANAPDPQIEGDYLVAPAGEDNRWGVGINYGFDWPGTYSARRAMGEAIREANSAEADAEILAKRVEIIGQLEAYLYADMRLEVMRKVMASSDSVRAIAEKSHSGGQMSRLDLSKIIIEQSLVQNTIAGIETERLSSEGILTTLNGGMPCTALLRQLDRKWDLSPLDAIETYLEKAKNNPDLLKTAAEYNVADKNVSVAKAERLPGFSVGYAHEFEDGINFNGANLGVSIPLFSSRNKVRAAEAAKAAAEYQMTVSTDKLESEIYALYNEITSLDKALETQTAVFEETDYTSLLMKAYSGGELSISEYLTELSWFYEAHLEYIDLQYQREQKATRLEMLCR